MRKSSFTIICLFLAVNSLFAQKYFRGLILDSETKQAVPFCNVYIKGKEGSVSNQKGQCLLNIEKASDKDSIVVSNILYHKKYIPVKDILFQKQNDTLYLKPQMYVLSDVVVEDTKVKHRVVEKGAKKRWFLGGDNNLHFRPVKYHQEQLAVFIENDFSKRKKVRLKSVRYNITDSTKTGALFKVHIYAVNDKAFMPGKELLLDNVIERRRMTSGWVEVDLSDYNIKMPEKGLFVAIEFLDYFIPRMDGFESNSNKYQASTTVYYDKTYLALHKTEYKGKKHLTFRYGVEKGWVREVPPSEDVFSENACISAKFFVYK